LLWTTGFDHEDGEDRRNFRLTKTDQIQKQMMTQMSAMMKQQTMADLTAEQRQTASDATQRVIEFTMQK